jgi:hypothetical protein
MRALIGCVLIILLEHVEIDRHARKIGVRDEAEGAKA